MDSDDPVLAGIAAWRRGRIAMKKGANVAVVHELFVALVGPAGLRRDAAAAALARVLGRPTSPAPFDRPPAPRTRDSEAALERWIARIVAPTFDPLPKEALAPHRSALAAALRTAESGTRAERAAARAAATACDEAPTRVRATDTQRTEKVCLRPLVRETIELPARGRDPGRDPGIDDDAQAPSRGRDVHGS